MEKVKSDIRQYYFTGKMRLKDICKKHNINYYKGKSIMDELIHKQEFGEPANNFMYDAMISDAYAVAEDTKQIMLKYEKELVKYNKLYPEPRLAKELINIKAFNIRFA
jgi:hypothetical protein